MNTHMNKLSYGHTSITRFHQRGCAFIAILLLITAPLLSPHTCAATQLHIEPNTEMPSDCHSAEPALPDPLQSSTKNIDLSIETDCECDNCTTLPFISSPLAQPYTPPTTPIVTYIALLISAPKSLQFKPPRQYLL